MSRVKICGITNLEDAESALSLGAKALGFNFYAKSPRYISPEKAGEIIRLLPKADCWMVGVFVNSTTENISEVIKVAAIDTLQFHGEEDEQFLRSWKDWRTIRALALKEETQEAELRAALTNASYLLLDAHDKNLRGGTGKLVPAELLARVPSEILKQSFLAGGITPKNARERLEKYQPYGLDLASGVESAAGKKSLELMEELFRNLNQTSSKS